MKSLLAILTLTLVLLLLPALPTYAAEKNATFDDILATYPLGSYFTKNGKRCTCHTAGNCVASGKNCNCLRYIQTKNGKYDLLGVQCVGFVRYCQYRLYGAIDYGNTKNRFKNVLPSALTAGKWNAATAKSYIQKAGVGAHIRIGGHSLMVMSISDTGFTSLECNGTIYGSECRVFSRTFTWEGFYQFYQGDTFRYLNVIRDEYRPVPETVAPVTTTPPVTTEAPVTTTPPETSEAPETTQAPDTTDIPSTDTSITDVPTTDAPVLAPLPETEMPSEKPDTPQSRPTPPSRLDLRHHVRPLPLLLPKREDEV